MADQLADCSDTQVIEALRPMKVVQCVKAISAFVGNNNKNPRSFTPSDLMIVHRISWNMYVLRWKLIHTLQFHDIFSRILNWFSTTYVWQFHDFFLKFEFGEITKLNLFSTSMYSFIL